ncbi:synaptosomal-associated protein 25 [Folsomia candida]|nr:synaptosomal-associated protein 25 [Folsomia candida]
MPPPPPESPTQPRNEAESLQLKASQVTDESLSSTRRMKLLCEEAKEAGIKTLVALDDQGEQLDNIEKGMHDINEDMVEAEKAMQGMGGCCFGLCPPLSVICAGKSKDEAMFKVNDDGVGGSGGPGPGRGLDGAGIPTYGGFISKYSNDAREDEMEQNMDEVSIMVGNLRNMAIDMGGEIGNQNNQIDRINMMAESNVTRINVANEKANQLLKK